MVREKDTCWEFADKLDGRWWEQYGDSAPLQRVAIRILSQVCSTCSFQKNWSTFQRLHSDKRNKIDKETLNDLLYINYNLKLARQTDVKCSDNDPLQLDDIDMTSEWVEEVENPSPTTQWLDRLGAVMDGNDLNTRQFRRLAPLSLDRMITYLVYDLSPLFGVCHIL